MGPYLYCDVNDLNDCETPQTVGKLAVDGRHPVQLSVPPAIARAPWVPGRAYEDSDVLEEFRPDSTLAVTIPTVDLDRGKLTRIVVQLPTIVLDAEGNERASWHAEWSIVNGVASACSVTVGHSFAFWCSPAVRRRQTVCRPRLPGRVG